MSTPEARSSDAGPLVSRSLQDGVALLILDDPSRRNALSRALSDDLASAVAEVLAGGAGAIVIAAAPPVFCAGGSLDDLLLQPGPLSGSYAGLDALADAPVPTIAAVDGPAIGAGVSLAIVCDVVLVSERACFDPRFLDLAIHPGGGHLWLMARRVGWQGAMAMTVCGDVLSGAEAATAGLAWRCVDQDHVLPSALSMAHRAARRPAGLVARTKRTLAATASLPDRSQAAGVELKAQEWSVAQPEHIAAVSRTRETIRS